MDFTWRGAVRRIKRLKEFAQAIRSEYSDTSAEPDFDTLGRTTPGVERSTRLSTA